MTPNELLDKIAAVTEPSVYQFPTRIGVRIGQSDAMAARLLKWLQEQMPDATIGQFDDVLQSAQWWNTYLTSLQELGMDPDRPDAVSPEWVRTAFRDEA